MNLNPNFSLDEMLLSQTATKLDYSEKYKPHQEVINDLQPPGEQVSQSLRNQIGKIVRVTSSYRFDVPNRAIGGANTSQHFKGQAADVHTAGLFTEGLYQLLKASRIPFDQFIGEFHVSSDPAMQCLRGNQLRPLQIPHIGRLR